MITFNACLDKNDSLVATACAGFDEESDYFVLMHATLSYIFV
jgi:hypothetical protein